MSATGNKAKPCDYCGRRGEMKAMAGTGSDQRLYCHSSERSCYNDARGRYFEDCTCTKEYFKTLSEEFGGWRLTRRDPECKLHRNYVLT